MTSQRIIAHTLMQAKKIQNETLRVCSIGCADGMLDRQILQELKHTKVNYVGLDNDEQLVDLALEKLYSISPNIKVSTVTIDYEDINALKHMNMEKFDVIWMVNCTYYTTSLSCLLLSALSLLKANGLLLIVSSSKESVEELVTRFWAHQRQDQLHTTESVIASLTQLGIPHHIDREPITLDLTSHFSNNFTKAESKLVLDNLVLCRLTDYPPQVKELVLEYLRRITKFTECAAKVVSMSDLLLIYQE